MYFITIKRQWARRELYMKTQISIILASLFLVTSFSFAADTKLSKEDRQKMAEVHKKMAACLESDKSMSECHDEMMNNCNGMMGKSGCAMMGMGNRKWMKGGMMDKEDSSKTDKKNNGY
jgi:hypothetical protein